MKKYKIIRPVRISFCLVVLAEALAKRYDKLVTKIEGDVFEVKDPITLKAGLEIETDYQFPKAMLHYYEEIGEGGTAAFEANSSATIETGAESDDEPELNLAPLETNKRKRNRK